jgi:hypothetical protein
VKWTVSLAAILLGGGEARADWGAAVAAEAGVTFASLAWDGPSPGGEGELHLDDVYTGLGLGLDLQLWFGIGDDVRLGPTVRGAVVLAGEAELGADTIDTIGQLEATFDVLLRRGGRMMWRAGFGGAMAGFLGSGSDVASPDNVDVIERALGAVAHGGVLWPISRRAAVGIELRAAILLGPHLTYAPALVAVRLQLGGF